MRRLRESWLALGGSALIIALSVSSALGAGSAQDTFDNIGEQVSEFARSLAPGQNKDADEPDAEEQPDLEEDEQLDEADEADEADDETDADAVDADAELEPGDEGFDWTTVSHGFCVSWHAHQDENADSDEETSDETDADAVEADAELEPGDEGYDWSNHGEFVSYWATVGCDTEDGDEADADEADEADEADDEDVVADEELEPGDEGFDWTTVSHGFCVSWHAHEDETAEENLPEDGEDWKNHGEFVSHWATVGCDTEDGDEADADEADEEADAADDEEDADAKAERKAEREAARAERKAEREAARAERARNNGNGNGRGRGRP